MYEKFFEMTDTPFTRGIPVDMLYHDRDRLDFSILTDTAASAQRQNAPSIFNFCDKMHRLFPDKILRL